MKLIQSALALWKSSGTKVLGYISGAIPGMLLIPDLVPPSQQKWFLLASLLLGGLTVKRGYTNTKNTPP